ncbi:MAG: carboxypeptidase-like regulatory domain-containing protein [Cyclonatronaceae bacterium]
MKKNWLLSLFALLTLFLIHDTVLAQTGRIDGTVIDGENGEPMIGVNVAIEGTTQGAITNLDGYFTIINVRPGEYTLRASMIGFSTLVVQDVRVNIDQTTTVDFELTEQVIEGAEVVVRAERPVVERDVSSSRVNLSKEQIENLPVSDITSVVGLQAGIQGLTVRGGSSDQLSFMVNGLSMRDERDNTPYTAISFTAISDVQIQTGGFNAEYGNVRSGIVNVITKEGQRDRYTADVLVRYTPAFQKHFGPAPNNPNSYWLRPYLDNDVAWTGTESGAWDVYTQQQYPQFEGWNAVAEQNLNPEDPYYGMTPEALQQLFLWQHRKNFAIQDPDYDVDFSFGGPVPFVSKSLGDLRFYASHRRSQDMYIVPLSRDRYQDNSSHIKFTSDLKPGMKLMVEGLYGEQSGTNSNNAGLPGIFRSASGIAGSLSQVSFIDSRMYATDYWAPTDVQRIMIGGKFTHLIDNRSYYDVTVNYFKSSYDTNPGRLRNYEGIREFGNGFMADEAPFGFNPQPSSGVGSGLRMGVGMSNSRDSSSVAYLTAKLDYVNQLDRFNQLKTGIEFVRTDSRVNYASVDEFLPSGRSWSRWETTPIRGAVYAQNKLEFRGMVANLGLRLDYSYAGSDWYIYDRFDRAFAPGNYDQLDELLETEDTKHNVTLSPRLGVSFPITIQSKLFFNYGHFRSMPTPENLYLVQQSTENDAVSRIANPNNPLPKTVAYELGYEHNVLEDYLLRVAGYYRDVSDQPITVRYQSRDNLVNYLVNEPNSYEDTRGFEFTLSKVRGRWFRGFVNYTYMIRSVGRFGFSNFYENPADQREFERVSRANEQFKPVPRPYARLNLDFFSPIDFGPEWAGWFRPLGDWRLNVVTSWTAGYYLTWTGGGGSIPGVNNNLQYTDFWNMDLRLSKNLATANTQIQFFIDVNNVLNYRYMSSAGFVDGQDYINYMRSLHLPASVLEPLGYSAVPGSDRPGNYRKPGAEFVPIEAVPNISNVNNPRSRPLYYQTTTGEFYQFVDGAWQAADRKFVDQVLKDKAYIDMPNQDFFTFLNPRNVLLGVRISL